jgi:hypothetical protein
MDWKIGHFSPIFGLLSPSTGMKSIVQESGRSSLSRPLFGGWKVSLLWSTYFASVCFRFASFSVRSNFYHSRRRAKECYVEQYFEAALCGSGAGPLGLLMRIAGLVLKCPKFCSMRLRDTSARRCQKGKPSPAPLIGLLYEIFGLFCWCWYCSKTVALFRPFETLSALRKTRLKLLFVVASRTRCSFHYGFYRWYLALSADVGTVVKVWPYFGLLSCYYEGKWCYVT